MSTYLLRDTKTGETSTIQAADQAAAREQGRRWAAEDGEYADWDNYEGDYWTASTDILAPTDDEDEYEADGQHWVVVDTVEVELTQPEPPCPAGEHDWQAPHEIVGGMAENPGVQGHGGGVIISEVCVHCGCGKHTDTWAQNHEDGSQGHTTIRYAVGEYTDALADQDDEA